MLLLVLLLEILAQFTTQTKIESRCHQDVHLPCNTDFKGKNYFSVTWYKDNKKGIIRKTLMNSAESLYDFPRNVSINEQNSLVLSDVTPADSGKYECAVSANVGGKNLHLFVNLMVHECEPSVTTVSTTTVGTVGTEGTAVNNTFSDSAPYLPLSWSLLGFGTVALTKVLLSTIIVRGFHMWTRRRWRW